MKIMVAFGIPPSGKKVQVLRRTLMPDGDKTELIKKICGMHRGNNVCENVHIIVKEV